MDSFIVTKEELKEKIVEQGVLGRDRPRMDEIVDDYERKFFRSFEGKITKTGNECEIFWETTDRRMSYVHPEYGSVGATSCNITNFSINRLRYYDELEIIDNRRVYADHHLGSKRLREIIAIYEKDSLRDIELIQGRLNKQNELLKEIDKVDQTENLPGVTKTFTRVTEYDRVLQELTEQMEDINANSKVLKADLRRLITELGDQFDMEVDFEALGIAEEEEE